MKKTIFIALALLTNSFSVEATRDKEIKNWFVLLNKDFTQKTNYEEQRFAYEQFFRHLEEAINKKYLDVANLGMQMNTTFLRHLQHLVGTNLPIALTSRIKNELVSGEEIDFMDAFNQHCISIFSADSFSTAITHYEKFLTFKNSPLINSFSYASRLGQILNIILHEHCGSLLLAQNQSGSLLTQISQNIASSNQLRERQIINWFTTLNTTFYEQLDYKKASFLYKQFFAHIIESLEKEYFDAANMGIDISISFLKHLHDITIEEYIKEAYSEEIGLIQRLNNINSQTFSIHYPETIEKIKTELENFVKESKGLGCEYAYQLSMNLQSIFDKCLYTLIPERISTSSSDASENTNHADPTTLKILGDTLDARRLIIKDDEEYSGTNDILPTCTTSAEHRHIVILPKERKSYETIKKLICEAILYNEHLNRKKGTALAFSDTLFNFNIDNFSFCLDDFKITIPKIGAWRCTFKDTSYQLTDADILLILDLVGQCYNRTIESDVDVKPRVKKWAVVNAAYGVRTTSAHASSGTNIASKHTKSAGLNGEAAADAISLINTTKSKFYNMFRILSEQYYREKEQEAFEEEEAIQRAIREEEEERLQEQKRIAEEQKRARWNKFATDARKDVAAMDNRIAKGLGSVPQKPLNLFNDIKTGTSKLKPTPKTTPEAPRKHLTTIIPEITNEESDSDSDEWED